MGHGSAGYSIMNVLARIIAGGFTAMLSCTLYPVKVGFKHPLYDGTQEASCDSSCSRHLYFCSCLFCNSKIKKRAVLSNDTRYKTHKVLAKALFKRKQECRKKEYFWRMPTRYFVFRENSGKGLRLGTSTMCIV